MRFSKLATAALLSATISLSASADLAQDVSTKGAEAVIAEAMQQGQSLEAAISNLATALKDSPQLLSQVIAQAVKAFPKQAAQIVFTAISAAPKQAKSITDTAVSQAKGNPALQAAIKQASKKAVEMVKNTSQKPKTEVVAENLELPPETVTEQPLVQQEAAPQPIAPPPPPKFTPPPADKPISGN